MNDVKGDSVTEQDKHALEKAELEEQIRTLKQQRLLAILSTIGAVLAFFILNHGKIMNIVKPPPKIRLEVKDPYLRKIGKLHIENTGAGSSGSAIDTSVKAALDWIPMKEGAYRLVLSANNEVFFKQEIILKAGDRQIILVPQQRDRTIHVTVKNKTPKPPPGSPLQLEIESSGNGYLWIYDLPKESKPALIYPPETVSVTSHAIIAGKAFPIPDRENNAIFVANEPTEERLLVVVTSSDSRITADKIAARMSDATISKASSGKIEENWGISLINYRVGL
ncbi:MAG TPA: DUF4384 domain-containing protein [Deltaproteobacteria bacterium]|nr:DUF4384 domain-containing protein [Deltaproteobacteria bacterium]